MNQALMDRIVRAVLYEGYMLYPYRIALKNHQRWTFGGVYPRSWSEARAGADAWLMRTECLVVGDESTSVEASLRFLHLVERTVGVLLDSPGEPGSPVIEGSSADIPPFRPVESLQLGEDRHYAWQEAVERRVSSDRLNLSRLTSRSHSERFYFPPLKEWEWLHAPQGPPAGVLCRERQALEGTLELSARRIDAGLFQLIAQVTNDTAFAVSGAGRDAALLHTLVSTHTVLEVHHGEFISLMDPPDRWREAAAACRNIGTWPVLVGESNEKDAMLSAPIILYDYPQVAPESPGDLFDCTEIDEILTLRIQTLTEAEKREAAGLDPGARTLLERTEALARQQLERLHGALREPRPIEGRDP